MEDSAAAGSKLESAGEISAVVVHSVVLVGLFWASFVASEVTFDVLVFAPWLYVLGLYWSKISRMGRRNLELAPVRTLGEFSFHWIVLYPVAVFLGNLIGLKITEVIVTSSMLSNAPILGPISDQWNWLYASGLSALVLYTSLLCVIVGLVGLAGSAGRLLLVRSHENRA